MKFGPVHIDNAEGTVLAHSVKAGDQKLRKGHLLGPSDIALLMKSGIAEVVVARLDAGDVAENDAARIIAERLGNEGLAKAAAFTGRANLIATSTGVLRVDIKALGQFNRIDEAVTIATLPDFARVQEGQMVATIKIIPYAIPDVVLAQALMEITAQSLVLHPFKARSATLILSQSETSKPKLLEKAKNVTRRRMEPLGVEMHTKIVPHNSGAIAGALKDVESDFSMILGASATADRADTCPAALVEAGGHLARFGLPVDPGNLLFLGDLDGRPVVGLPGCARSPALNGADWVLERVAAGLPISDEDIADMGVGGLLKEIPSRPQPRRRPAPINPAPKIEIVLLAAGQSRRMRGADKMLEKVGDETCLSAISKACLASKADRVIAVLPPDKPERNVVLKELNLEIVTAKDADRGMSASIRAGMAAVSRDADAALLVLGDMPDVTSAHIDQIIAAFDPSEDQLIVRATSACGKPGHPVLFGHGFFEALSQLTGDVGAKEILATSKDVIKLVALDGDAAILDLDTPEDWAAWRAGS